MPSNVDELLSTLQAGQLAHEPLPGVDPPGNYYAGGLKQIHDDSFSVFPASEYSSRTQMNKRWLSTVHGDFVPIDEQERLIEEKKVVKLKEHITARKVQLPKVDMFNKWRVPSRLTNPDGGSQAGDLELEVESPPPTRQSCKQLPVLPNKRDPIRSAVPHTARASLHSYRAASHMSNPPVARQEIQSARAAAFSAEPFSQSYRNKFRDPAKPKSLNTKELLRNYQTHEPHGKLAEAMLQNATTEQEKKMIEAALKTYAGGMKNDSRDVEKWKKTATDKERVLAMEFFKSQLTNNPSTSQKRKIQSAMRRLETGQESNHVFGSAIDPWSEDDVNFRYLRLLTPKTRANKWMHQTWHHMPSYSNTNPVENKTAMYTDSQKITPRHFIIHPDLG